MENNQLLTYLFLAPLVGAAALLFVPKKSANVVRWLAFGFSLIPLAISLLIYARFDAANPDFQFTQKILWIETINVHYHVGADGISVLLLLLTAFITPLTLLSTWKSITVKVKEFSFFMLFLEAGMIGVFISLDLFLFYVFWEAMLIPMYFIIGVWGGERKIYAAVKFFIYTFAGSLLMLVAIVALGLYAADATGYFTTNLLELYEVAPGVAHDVQLWLFLAFALSFAIKVPLFPLHTWLPDAHVEAPAAGSVILAGVLLKMGTYGLVRFCLPLFPEIALEAAPYMSILAVVGIIYGALVAMVQPDVKKLVAYSSVSHLGFVVLGVFAFTQEAMQGAVIQMINHGLSTGALFLLVGFLYDRTHTRMIADYGGIAKVVPIYSTFFMIATLSSIGLPGLNGFVGEFLILAGTFKSAVLGSWAYAIFAASGVIFAAVYMLWMYQRVFFNTITNEKMKDVKDLTARELAVLIPVVVFIVWIGVYPETFLHLTDAASAGVLDKVFGAASASIH